MNKIPKISIITPSYNQGQYIEQTILSVLDENYPNLEYIIIDGGSTDNTVEIIKKYEHRISYWISEPDNGQTDAINKGYQIATGEIINWLNSDDYLEKGALQKIAAEFEKREITCVAAKVRDFIEDTSIKWESQIKPQKDSISFQINTFCHQPGTYFRSDIIKKYFPIPQDLHWTMDQYLWFCYWLEARPENLYIADFVAVNFRRHNQSKTVSSKKFRPYKTLSPSFFNDYHSIFTSFFYIYGTKEMTEILENFFFKEHSSWKLKMNNFNPRSEQIERLFHRYLLTLLEEDYRAGYFDRLTNHLNKVQTKWISEDDKAALLKLRKKNKFRLILKVYRNLYWKFKS